MDLMPILSTLRRHKTAASLIVLEIALTTAIVCNALHLIALRLERLHADSGLPEAQLVVLTVRATTAPSGKTADAQTQRDLASLRALPGVRHAAIVNQIAFGDGSDNSGVRTTPDAKAVRLVATDYDGSLDAPEALGLQLVAGRGFRPDELVPGWVFNAAAEPRVDAVIVNQHMADALFPGGQALGKSIYVYGQASSTIVGIVRALPHPFPGSEYSHLDSMMFPVRPTYRGGYYVLRVADPAQRDAVLRAARTALEANDPTRVVTSARRLQDMRADFYAPDRAMVGLMSGVCVALLAVTAFGIVGLASFWVQQRTRMIGTRRALGATMGQILRYFQLENFVLTSLGIAIGMFGAYGVSLLMAAQAELPPLPAAYLPVGALVLWALGQLAVWAPARRAALLPPVAALRA
jgi:putative ABC transport system permease protein